MSVLKSYFNHSVNQNAQVSDVYLLVDKVDKDGNTILVPQKIDYAEIQKSHGTVDMWSIDALMKAGINPAFNIHTGNVTRLEGIYDVNSVLSEIPESVVTIEETTDTITDTTITE